MYHCVIAYQMSKFVRHNFALKTLADNSYKAIDEGAYDSEKYNFYTHNSISLKRRILSCPHAALITEIKFSSPSRGEIIDKSKINLSELACTMVAAGSISLSVVTQPRLFGGSIDHLAKIRKNVNVPLLMKDVIVSETQIDAAKRIGSDCILFIKSIFDHDLAEASMERFAEYAYKKGLQILLEVHSEKEFQEVLRFNKDNMNNLIGINNRDLNNLNVDICTTERLLMQYSKGKNIVISESGINTAKEIQFLKNAGADAFLVGTSIMESNDIASKVSELYLSV
jgi:indole-3-glycerol phosphate synthase